MTREKRRAELIELFHEKARIARTFGMRLSFTEDDTAVVDLPHNPGLDHAMGGIHGGVYATLLDTAGWFASAVAARIALRAEGRILKRGKRQDVVEMFLYDAAGELVGHGTGTMMVLPHIPLDPSAGGQP